MLIEVPEVLAGESLADLTVRTLECSDLHPAEPRLALLVGVEGCPGPWELEVVPLDPGSLLGWEAPPRVLALGVQIGGQDMQVHLLEGGADTGRPPTRPLALVSAVDREGRWASTIDWADDFCDDPPEGGRLYDTMLRCLSLPTPEPEVSTARLVTAMWLAVIGAADPQPATWAEVIGLHPLVAYVDLPEGLAERDAACRAADDFIDWEFLRSIYLSRELEHPIPADLVAWMDPGMFARELDALVALEPAMARANYLCPSIKDQLTSFIAASVGWDTPRGVAS